MITHLTAGRAFPEWGSSGAAPGELDFEIAHLEERFWPVRRKRKAPPENRVGTRPERGPLQPRARARG